VVLLVEPMGIEPLIYAPLALTARSLHCRGSVRLQSYFHRPGEAVSTPARDPEQSWAPGACCDAASPALVQCLSGLDPYRI